MKTVLFLIPTLGGGGAERVLVNLANNLDKNKYIVTIQTVFKAGINASNLNSGVKLIEGRFKQFRGNKHFFKLFSPVILYRFIVRRKYDIVVSYLEGPTARIISGCPYDSKKISWIHVEQKTKAKASGSYRSYVEALECHNKFDVTVCVAETVKKDIQSIFQLTHPVKVIYNTNEDDKILQMADDASELQLTSEIRVFTMGRLVEEKGFDRLIRVHRRLLDSGIKHHVYLLGNGPLLDSLKKLTVELKVSDTFHFLGFQENPYKFISKSDLFVCSSDREGFSTSVTEAIILGVPVVSTNVSGATELLGDNNEYGIVTAISDDSLYDGLFVMLSDTEKLPYFREKVKERRKLFTREASVAAVDNLFSSLF